MSERSHLLGDDPDEESLIQEEIQEEGNEDGYNGQPIVSFENIHFVSEVYNSHDKIKKRGTLSDEWRKTRELNEPTSIHNIDKLGPRMTGTPETTPEAEPEKSVDWKFVIFAIFLVFISSGNDVASQIQTVPMGNFSFFLGIFNGFAYCTLYFIILSSRLFLGWTSKEQLKYAWYWNRNQPVERNVSGLDSFLNFFKHIPQVKYFVALGFLDGIGTLMGLIAKPHITGDIAVLVPQTSLLFIVVVSMVVLGTRYSYWQLWSVLLVLFGVILSIYPKLSGSGISMENLIYIFIMAMSPLSAAFSFVIKEKLFTDFKQLHGSPLDIFIVNSHGSLFQLILQPVIIPIAFLVNPKLLAVFADKPDLKVSFGTYLYVAFSCFSGVNRNSSIINATGVDGAHIIEGALTTLSSSVNPRSGDCSPMPYPYIAYIIINLTMNVSFLFFVRNTTALMSFMTTKATIPLSICLFYLNWPPWEKTNPILQANKFSWFTIAGLVVILCALTTYRLTTGDQQKYKQSCCSVEIRPLDDYLDGVNIPSNSVIINQ